MKGIYKITVKNNRQFYVGSSFDIAKRWEEHTTQLKENKHHNYRLQNLFDKYGLECLIFEIIEEYTDIKRQDLYLIEESYISLLKPQLNIRKTTGKKEETNKSKTKKSKNKNNKSKTPYGSATTRYKKRFANVAFKRMYAR